MKKIIFIASAILAMGVSAQASANATLAKEKNCMACHSIDKKIVGPGYKEVALKYKGQKNAEDVLTKKVLAGGAGVWGPVPMPANSQVTEAEARTLVKWILSLK